MRLSLEELPNQAEVDPDYVRALMSRCRSQSRTS
jgi:hypothetical protein